MSLKADLPDWQHTHTWNTGDLDDWCSGCLDLTLGTYTALTEYKENNKLVLYLGFYWHVSICHIRSIEALCRAIQNYEMIKIDLDQVGC